MATLCCRPCYILWFAGIPLAKTEYTSAKMPPGHVAIAFYARTRPVAPFLLKKHHTPNTELAHVCNFHPRVPSMMKKAEKSQLNVSHIHLYTLCIHRYTCGAYVT